MKLSARLVVSVLAMVQLYLSMMLSCLNPTGRDSSLVPIVLLLTIILTLLSALSLPLQ